MIVCVPRWVYTGSKAGDANNGWEKQPYVTVVTVETRQKEDMILYEKRRQHCAPVDVRGATGPLRMNLLSLK